LSNDSYDKIAAIKLKCQKPAKYQITIITRFSPLFHNIVQTKKTNCRHVKLDGKYYMLFDSHIKNTFL